jgi:hypothetical protein
LWSAAIRAPPVAWAFSIVPPFFRYAVIPITRKVRQQMEDGESGF